ncbi:hypothetical protein QTH87_22830 [Variovorax sp. J22P168]|uniref:hypothetical protein n=1 Tax=Variovorax jilinensis TaxID=3053513 RepID=UPI002574AF47|nr:hypothetical protein [Variovorax sp. J22P168]MDM0015296.1 hypothetical protein [Variovorax sp. J22P168]
MAEKRMSPSGGFLIQSREGNAGNFEVVIPWSDSGLAHFGRANDTPGFPWLGPFRFGAGYHYLGASVIESDFKEHPDRDLGNLEVLATTSSGEVHHYWRENGGAFRWNGPFRVFDRATTAPSLAYTRQTVAGSSFYVVAGNLDRGLQYWERRNQPTIMWIPWDGTAPTVFVGMSLALTAIGAASPHAEYSEAGVGGDHIVAAVSNDGNVHLVVEGVGGHIHVENGIPSFRNWLDHAAIGVEMFFELHGQFRGRPSLIQGDYNLEEPALFRHGHYGNLELIVPAARGGFFHFWRISGIPGYERQKISWGWGGPVKVSGPIYDEVSMIQSSFSRSDHGNLEVVARHRDQMGFDFYWRDEAFAWHGPFPVS